MHTPAIANDPGSEPWALITGSDSGIGRATARAFALQGIQVIMACRTIERAASMRASSPAAIRARLHPMQLDLADLAAIGPFASRVAGITDRIQTLVNNAGVMEPPFKLTTYGHESQFSINHLSHFALTQALMRLLQNAGASRVVTMSSLSAAHGIISFEPPDPSRYDKAASYRASKLANLLFALELDRRLRDQGSRVLSLAVHPGYARTRLQRHVPGVLRKSHAWLTRMLRAQSAEDAALCVLHAAQDPDLTGGAYIGPAGRGQLRGTPVTVAVPENAQDPGLAQRLWEHSAALLAKVHSI